MTRADRALILASDYSNLFTKQENISGFKRKKGGDKRKKLCVFLWGAGIAQWLERRTRD